MFCKKCGKQIPDDTKFCPYCGATCSKTVSATPTAPSVSQTVDNSENQKPKSNIAFVDWFKNLFSLNAFDYLETVAKDTSNTGIIILVIEVALIAIGRILMAEGFYEVSSMFGHFFRYGFNITLIFSLIFNFIKSLIFNIFLTVVIVGIIFGAISLIFVIEKKKVDPKKIANIIGYSLVYYVIFCVITTIFGVIPFLGIFRTFIAVLLGDAVTFVTLLLIYKGIKKIDSFDNKLAFIFVGLYAATCLLNYYFYLGLFKIGAHFYSFIRGWFF